MFCHQFTADMAQFCEIRVVGRAFGGVSLVAKVAKIVWNKNRFVCGVSTRHKLLSPSAVLSVK